MPRRRKVPPAVTVWVVHRRVVGSALLAVIPVTLALVAWLRPVAGRAELPADTALPGRCLAAPGRAIDQPVAPGLGDGETWWETATFAFPAAPIVDCSQPHAGVVLAADYRAVPPASATLPQLDEQDARCRELVDAAILPLGYRDLIDRYGPALVDWRPVIGVTGGVVGPTDAARRSGQGWSGCALFSSDGPLPAVLTGPLPGRCVAADAPDASDPAGVVPCATPHRTQILAQTDPPGSNPTADHWQRSCEAAAQRFLHTGDPTRGGALRVEYVPGEHLDLCVVTVADGALLAGSVLGIGAGPLPWVA